MNKILITGANGFIGSHLVEECQQRGYDVLAGVRKGSHLSNLKHLETDLIELDYSNPQNLKTQLAQEKLNYVVHAAGVTVAQSEEGYSVGNCATTTHLLAAIRKHPIKKFVYVSSLAARGPGIASIDNPISQYGVSKLRAEKLLEGSETPFLVVRPTAVYGPRNIEFLPLFKWANRGLTFRSSGLSTKLTFIHVTDLCGIIFDQIDEKEPLIYASDGRTYTQVEINKIIMGAVKRQDYLAIPIPAWFLQTLVGLIEFIVSKIFRRSWAYPKGKVKELTASDWSIKEEISVDEKIPLKEGFYEMAEFYLAKGWL